MELLIGALVVAGTAGIVSLVAVAGETLWRREVDELCGALRSGAGFRLEVAPAEEIEHLPAPLRRYLDTAIADGVSEIGEARIRHRGTFNMGGERGRWVPFESRQVVVPRSPGFVWNARMRVAPLITVRVLDAYVEDAGVLFAKLLGIMPVMRATPGPALDQGELTRYLAESPWYPTALLPAGGVSWSPIDDRSCRARLETGREPVELVFNFDDEGMVGSVVAEARCREVEGRQEPTRWEGRFWGYRLEGGFRVPIFGEAAWLLPEGRKPYWRGEITSVEHDAPRAEPLDALSRNGAPKYRRNDQ